MSFLVPAVLGGLALAVMAIVSTVGARRRDSASAESAQPKILIHSINDDRCTGCDACVAVCPTNVLDLIDNKSRVVRFQDCIQCEACMWACPTTALVMHHEGTTAPTLTVPQLDDSFQTEIAGQYLIGEVAGKPLVKNAANLGRGVVEHMLTEGLVALPPHERTQNQVDVAIVGSGPGGLSAALTCIQRGLSYVLLEKDQMIASTIAHYPKGKLVMAEPYDCPNVSLLPVFDSSKEQLLPLWEELTKQVGLQVNLGEAVEGITKNSDGSFAVKSNVSEYRSQRVVLATGTRGKPRTLGVPGENLPKVQSLLDDPNEFRGQPVLVVGGGDSALEAAVALADAGARVLLSYRGRRFSRALPKNKQAIDSYVKQKRINVLYQSQITEFDESTVTVMTMDNSRKRYPNAAAFVLIGSDPPVKWLSKLGVNFVERPHSYRVAASDKFVLRFLGQKALVCPETLEGAYELITGRRAAPRRPVSGPRKWIRSATAALGASNKLKRPMLLSEFAKQSSRRRHGGRGRRDQLPPSERTRVLRMLRDEGGRMAHEESEVYLLDEDGNPTRGDFREPAVPLSDEGSAPKQAVIVGLARAMAKSPRVVRRPRGQSPAGTPSRGRKPQGSVARRRPPLPSPNTSSSPFEETTRAVDVSSLLSQGEPATSRVAVVRHGAGSIALSGDDPAEAVRRVHNDPTRSINLREVAAAAAVKARQARKAARHQRRAQTLSDVEWDID